MRSLTVKLTFAFVLVGLTGAILVAVLVGIRTRSDFNRFLSERDQSVLVTALGNYYAAHGSWEGVGDMIARTPPLDFYSHRSVLVDAAGRVVLGSPSYPVGQAAPRDLVDAGVPVQ
ncbi:MAG TPA: two-component sensor histidine kinase, partial [Roseiflexaceae bacterium]